MAATTDSLGLDTLGARQFMETRANQESVPSELISHLQREGERERGMSKSIIGASRGYNFQSPWQTTNRTPLTISFVSTY